jgi:uncharacterized membrane protein (UPF0127 family)
MLLTILAPANIGIYGMAQKKRKKKQDKTERQRKNNLKSLIMKAGLITIALVVAAVFILNNCDDDPNDVNYYKFKKEGELTFIDSTSKEIVKIDIEIADTDYERQLGLMNRENMEELQGMLFIFPTERYQSFWMLNTLFSLDMLFINQNNEIVTIHKNTTPLSRQSYPSSKPAKYVLEVIAGFTDKYNIKEDDKVFWIGTKINL